MFAQFRRVFADLWRSDQQLERSAEPAAPAGDNEIAHPMLLRVHLRQADFAIPNHVSSYAAGLHRINSRESCLSRGGPNFSALGSRLSAFRQQRGQFVGQEDPLPELKDNTGRPRRPGRTRATALGFGLGATLALSPLVWAENFGNTAPQAGATVPE